jgi:hypothetical protein
MISMYIPLFRVLRKYPSYGNHCNLYQRIPVNYSREFRKFFGVTTYSAVHKSSKFGSEVSSVHKIINFLKFQRYLPIPVLNRP